MSQKCHSVLHDKNGRLLGQVASVSADLPHGHVIREHSHPEDQLLFASTGVMTLSTGQGIWVVPPMRAIWIPADTPHSVRMAGAVSMRTLYFLPRLCRALPPRCFVMNVSAFLRELILHACSLSRLNRRKPSHRRIADLLIDQLKEVRSVPLQLPRPADIRARRVMEALFANPGEQRTLARLSKDCGASKRTIQRLFLEQTTLTFAKWRQQLRLLHAMQLLASGDQVTAAALEAGYGSTSAFIAMFRKQLGTTPARYLKNPGERSPGAPPSNLGAHLRRSFMAARVGKHETHTASGLSQPPSDSAPKARPSASSIVGQANRNPASVSFAGTARALASNASSAISPSASRSANAGAGRIAGR